MEFFVSTSAPSRQRTDCAIVGVYDKGVLTETAQAFDRKIGGRISRLLKRGDLRGKTGDVVLLTDIQGAACERILIVGLGARDTFKRKQYRKAIQSARHRARAHRRERRCQLSHARRSLGRRQLFARARNS
jgi:Leucyl aminopeptidase